MELQTHTQAQTQTQTTKKSVDESHSFQTSHARWLALINRSPSAHFAFLYGVKSTKIYCRPTCTARLARRANVVFYDNENQALNDGFRPCKRCQPENTAFIGHGEDVTSKVIALLRIPADSPHAIHGGIKSLAKEVGVTPSYLCRVFKKTMGITIGAYMKEFEKTDNEDDKDSDSQPRSTSTIGSSPGSLLDDGEKPLSIPATPINPKASSCATPAIGLDNLVVTDGSRDFENILNFDFDVTTFSIDELISDDFDFSKVNHSELDKWLYNHVAEMPK